jgi:hypothetical protein
MRSPSRHQHVIGTFSGYFRDSDWAAKDHVTDRVVPFSNQQYSVTFGGPIKRDRIHYFGNYEYEREPQTAVYTGPFPAFNTDLSGIRTQNTAGIKTDFQFTPKTHMSARVNGYTQFVPLRGAGGATTHPSGASQWWRTSTQYWDQLTHVLSNNKVNELKGGVYMYDWDIAGLASYNGGPAPNFPGGKYPIISSHTMPKGAVTGAGNSATLGGSPRIQLTGYKHRHGDEPAADYRPAHNSGARRLHDGVRREGPPRRADGRRVPRAQLPLLLVQLL